MKKIGVGTFLFQLILLSFFVLAACFLMVWKGNFPIKTIGILVLVVWSNVAPCLGESYFDKSFEEELEGK